MLDPELQLEKIKGLDEWAKGALIGFAFGWIIALGILWAVMEKF